MSTPSSHNGKVIITCAIYRVDSHPVHVALPACHAERDHRHAPGKRAG
jgi:hypothetical protein